MVAKQHCDCYNYPSMHDEHRICVNWDLHNGQPCPEYHTRQNNPILTEKQGRYIKEMLRG